ncbi:MAG: hypothetical protein NTW32_15420 [Chloroflexi bacterium]|nr:hypothetical protein [Chloroflexota bacterium]
MTDWYTIVDSIRVATLRETVDKAQLASESLQEKKDRQASDKFQLEMKELSRHLQHMQAILAHEDIYTLDELADALGNMLGPGQNYHRIAHYEVKHK